MDKLSVLERYQGKTGLKGVTKSIYYNYICKIIVTKSRLHIMQDRFSILDSNTKDRNRSLCFNRKASRERFQERYQNSYARMRGDNY